jgi:hypothetical protein
MPTGTVNAHKASVFGSLRHVSVALQKPSTSKQIRRWTTGAIALFVIVLALRAIIPSSPTKSDSLAGISSTLRSCLCHVLSRVGPHSLASLTDFRAGSAHTMLSFVRKECVCALCPSCILLGIRFYPQNI